MENILNHINEFKFLYLTVILLLLAVIILIIILKKRTKKIEPICLEEIEERNEKKSDLEEVIKAMESNTNDRMMTTFEQEQEANAIISYQELVKAVNEKKAKMNSNKEVTEKELDLDEEIEEYDELTNEEELLLEAIEVTAPKVEEVKEKKVEPKFKSSEFISPVFGKSNTKTNDDFLKELKDFRNNL